MRVRPLMSRLLLSLLLAVAFRPLRAEAHDVRGTALLLDVGERALELELQLPLEQVRLALQKPIGGGPALSDAEQRELSDYVQRHLHASTRSGAALRVSVRELALTRSTEGDPTSLARVDVLRVRARMEPPERESVRWLKLRYDAIVHRVVTHNIYVFVRRDLENALLGERPELVGLLHYQNAELVVDRTGGDLWRGFAALFTLGVQHIREGTDHLLFLLLLLLPAPLLVEPRRWAGAGGAKRSAIQTAKIVTAFTLGHSLTLLLGALWGADLPVQPVEIAIALSILVSGVHALRPIFAGREALVAGGFGLVHGLAFSGALAGFGFDGSSLAVSVLGFNLGVEAMQLAIVALLMPWLWLASLSAHYGVLRRAGACFGVTAALGWLMERAFGLHTPVPAAVEALAARAPWFAAALAATASCLFLLRAIGTTSRLRSARPSAAGE